MNSTEAAVVVDLNGQPIFWHTPPGSSAVYLPDSRQLWDVLWENRKNLAGVAHSHPGHGIPVPSWEDVTTFDAIERGLGIRLVWWITTMDACDAFVYDDNVVSAKGPYNYVRRPLEGQPTWLRRLREISYPAPTVLEHKQQLDRRR
jgi:hypothetical protein